jgi:hypothetical protein
MEADISRNTPSTKLFKGSTRSFIWLRESDRSRHYKKSLMSSSPVQFDEEDPRAWIDPAVSGATGILKSLQKHK